MNRLTLAIRAKPPRRSLTTSGYPFHRIRRILGIPRIRGIPGESGSMAESEAQVFTRRLAAKGTVTIPAEILRAWGLQGKPGNLVFYLHGRRVSVFTSADLEDFLADQERA